MGDDTVLNLLTSDWIPVRTRSGARRVIRPADIVTDLNGDGAIAPDWPRPDLDIATQEFLIGLLAIAMPPRTFEEWQAVWHDPPRTEHLDAVFAPIAHAFELGGEGPRFLQEFGGLDGEVKPVDLLLIDAAGDNAQRKNADLLVHRGRYAALSPAAAAMALYALQAFAPAGGAGIRTSMRGGGPMTTLVIPATADGGVPSLWHRVWAHVPEGEIPDAEALARILPWLTPTYTSEKGGAGTIHQRDRRVHPLQAFFGMPRRIRLRLTAGPATCSLTGKTVRDAVTGVVQRPHGVDYGIWKHPLTPYRRQKPESEPYSMKPKAGRIAPGDWVAAAVGTPDGLRIPAEAVHRARGERRRQIGAGARLLAAGWVMNNMEAVEYLFAETPLHVAADETVREEIDGFAARAAEAAEIVHGMLRQALVAALPSTTAATDQGLFSAARNEFLDRIEGAFHERLAGIALAQDPDEAFRRCDAANQAWRQSLERAALLIFDAHASVLLNDAARSARIVRARGLLARALHGWGSQGKRLFDRLSLHSPEKQKEMT